MKKFAIVGMIALMGAVVLPSCKKDYTCVCKMTGQPDASVPLGKSSKKDAKAACDLLSLNGFNCSLD